MTANHRGSGFKTAWQRGLAAAALALLAACAGPGAGGDDERLVDLPEEWDPIDIGEADLDLPLRSPFGISELKERVGARQIFENLYTFEDVTGYLVTSRVFFGHFSENAATEVGDLEDFRSFAEDQGLVRRRRLELASVKPFRHPEHYSSGYYTRAISPLGSRDCFVLRVGYLLVEYSSFEREPEDIDTVLYGTLCSPQLDETRLLALLTQVQVVEDRDVFRKALSKRRIGTI